MCPNHAQECITRHMSSVERRVFIKNQVMTCEDCKRQFQWDVISGVVHPGNEKGSHVFTLGEYSRESFYRGTEQDQLWCCPECGGKVWGATDDDLTMLPNDCVNIWHEEPA